MFSVYGKFGKLFSGSLEELRRVGPNAALQGVRGVRAVGQEGQDHRGIDSATDSSGQPAPHLPPDAVHRSAVAAYVQTSHPPTARHALVEVDAIMSHSVVTVPDRFTVEQAWAALGQHNIGQAPVVNAQGVLVGLFTRGELLRANRLPKADSHPLVWRAFMARSVSEVMWSPVASVALGTDIRRVARVLLDTGLPGLPVVDGEGLVIGFVSRSDILQAVVAEPPLDLWT